MKKRLLASHCIFPTPNIVKTAEYYEQVMGFEVVKYLDAKEPHICLYRDDTEIILTDSKSKKVVPNRELYGYGYDAYFITDNQEDLQKELDAAGAKIVRVLSKTDYHNQEFVVEDIDGRWIGFGIKTEEKTEVSFREITEDTVIDVIRLSNTLLENQDKAVAPNAVSIAQAHFSKNAWFRAIYAGEELVGFIMLDNTPLNKLRGIKHTYLWRFMIGGKFQKKGYGKAALELLIKDLKKKGYEKFLASCVDEEFGPLEFYKKLGFVETGKYDGDEKVIMLDL